ncbi:hypothetical protein F2Q68_00045087 [Brassica cretica]|uniref:Uncharacterized protein n=1 Tax=Brassica cretica TaxID=69181 RepID=A0A8S9LNX5_BRACR|nr:hypothetical protein F2Q68_00045087 [Brassica cretica]
MQPRALSSPSHADLKLSHRISDACDVLQLSLLHRRRFRPPRALSYPTLATSPSSLSLRSVLLSLSYYLVLCLFKALGNFLFYVEKSSPSESFRTNIAGCYLGNLCKTQHHITSYLKLSHRISDACDVLQLSLLHRRRFRPPRALSYPTLATSPSSLSLRDEAFLFMKCGFWLNSLQNYPDQESKPERERNVALLSSLSGCDWLIGEFALSLVCVATVKKFLKRGVK